MKKLQTKYIKISPKKCNTCRDCLSKCKTGMLAKFNLLLHKHVVVGNSEKCIGCKHCIVICPHEVIESI